MNVRVVKQAGDYLTVHKHASRNANLSYKAVGLHTYLMGQADSWEANVEQLTAAHSDGETAVRSGIQELIEHGYAVRVQRRQNGRIVGWRTDIYETPEANPHHGQEAIQETLPFEPENPDLENPDLENLNVENRGHNNNKGNNNKRNNNKVSSSPSAQKSTTRKPKPKSSTAYVHPDTGVSTNAIKDAYLETVEAYEPGSAPGMGETMKWAKILAERGWRPEQVSECYTKMKEDEFWQEKHLSLATIGKEIGARMGKGKAKQEPVAGYRRMKRLDV